MQQIMLFLQIITLQISEEFLEGTRTSVSGDLVSIVGQNVLTIIGLVIVGAIGIGFVLLMKTTNAKFQWPPGGHVARIHFVGLNGTSFYANVTENEEFSKHELKELTDSGVSKTAPEVIERLERENNFKVYRGKIIKYGHGVKWRSKNRFIEIHTRCNLNDPDFFSNVQRTARGWGSILEPEVTRMVFFHGCSEVTEIKTYSGKKKQVHTLGVLPTNPKIQYAQYSNIFKDRHITIPMAIDVIDPETSNKLGDIIEWSPKVAYLEKENKNKTKTLKDFDKIIDEKSLKNSKFNMVINKLRGALEQKPLTGKDVKRDPIRLGSQIMMGAVSVFIGGMAYAGWQSVPELVNYSPWFGVMVAGAVIAVLIHANEKKKKEQLENQDIELE